MNHLGRSAQRTIAEQINFSPTVALQSNFQIPAFSEILVDSSATAGEVVDFEVTLMTDQPENCLSNNTLIRTRTVQNSRSSLGAFMEVLHDGDQVNNIITAEDSVLSYYLY